MRRLTEIYATLAADRDHAARLCAELALSGAWDDAAAAARKYHQLQRRCDQIIEGSTWIDAGVSPSVDT